MSTVWPVLAGTCDRLALFVKNGQSAVLDTSDRTVIETGPTPELLGRFNWQPTYPGLVATSVHQQAALALGDDVKLLPSLAPVASGGTRTYAVPKQVQATAQRALAAATAPDAIAQADPIAVATARNLATGIPVTLPKLRQIARALSIRHTVTPAGPAGQTAQDATGAVYLLWGGNAARRWANGVINREDARAQSQFAAQALRAAAGDDAVPGPDGQIAQDTAQDDDLPDTNDMSPDEFRKTMFSGDIVPQEWFQTFYDSIAEGPHGFAESPDRPNLCLYCGAPFYFDIHDVNNRWINEPDKPHFYSESENDPNICAICNQPPNSELHQIDLSTTDTSTPDENAPAPQALAAYTPYHSIDASPGVLAALMSAEQALESQVQYYAAVAPDDPELAVGMFRNQGDEWSIWGDGIWEDVTTIPPQQPLQLLDEDTAFALVRFGMPTSIPAFDLEERALFEAARETLGLDDIVTMPAQPDTGVSYQVQMDVFEPNTGLGLSAICGDNTYIWDYGTGTWEQSEFGLPEGTDVADVPLDVAVSVAAQLLDHGSADLSGGEGSLIDDIQMLEGTGFNDLPTQGWDQGGGGWDEEDEHLDDDQIQQLFFMLQDTDDPGLALSLHAHPDPDTWQVWDPQDITWHPEDAPDSDRLIASGNSQAAEFAAWQYMAAHGIDTLDAATVTAAADRLATAQSAADFTTGYSAILLYRPPETQKSAVEHVEPLAAAAPLPGELYTPEERSKNASKQVRDRFGRFAHANSRVQLKSGETGHITSIDPERKTVTVTDDQGNVHDVPANSVTLIDEDPNAKGGPAIPPLDLSKIPAEPRAGARTTKASLPYLLPPMDKAALDKMFADYQAYVAEQRRKQESGG